MKFLRNLWPTNYLRKLFPPYFKYPVFLFVGMEFVYCAFLLAVSEAYYKSAALILPIAYKMFDDTVAKEVSDFDWTDTEKYILESYKYRMLFLWVISTFGVLLSMLIIIPQFFDFNDKRGNPSHLCLVQKKLGWVLFWMMVLFVIVLGITVTWAWNSGPEAIDLFDQQFKDCLKEEVYLTELEKTLECTTDDDKEVAPEHLCWQNVRTSIITKSWLDIIFVAFLGVHIISFLAIPFFNRQLFKANEDELLLYDERKLVEA